MVDLLTALARLRERNQLTIPDVIVREAGMKPGEVFVVELKTGEPDLVLLRRVRSSYAGVLRGAWGTDPGAHLEDERDAWD